MLQERARLVRFTVHVRGGASAQAAPGRSGCCAVAAQATAWPVVWGGLLGSVLCGAQGAGPPGLGCLFGDGGVPCIRIADKVGVHGARSSIPGIHGLE